MSPADLPEPGASDVLWVVDLSGLVHRFWHAVGPWAARNVGDLFRRFVDAQQPAHVAIVEDHPTPTWRHDLVASWGLPAYKGTRPEKDSNEKGAIAEQMRHASELAEDAFGFGRYIVPGFEADDLAATLTRLARLEGMRVVVVGADKDFAQLVDAPDVVTWNGKLVGKDRTVMGDTAVFERFGVYPHQMVDYQALVGDTIDAVAGVRGIGADTAVRILRQFGSMDRAFAAAANESDVFWVTQPRTGRIRKALLADGAREAADRARRLVKLVEDVPLERGLEAAAI